jgi:hypothetical protein
MDDLLFIIIIAGLVGSILGNLLRALRQFRAAKREPGLELQAGSVQGEFPLPSQPVSPAQEPSLPPQPASLRSTALTLIGLSLLVVMWGLFVGLTVGVFSHILYIVFLVPLAMGFGSGRGIAGMLRGVKIQGTWRLIFLSLLSAVIIYGTFHYIRYLGFQVQASLEIYSGLTEATDDENFAVTKALLNYALEEETGHSGFLGYMLYRANEGVSIGKLTRSSSLNLGPILTWLYWLAELAIILVVTIQMGKSATQIKKSESGKMVCESCRKPYDAEKHLGGTASANESFLLGLIRQKDFAELGRLMEPNAELPSLEVYYQGCKVCGKGPSQLVVRRASQSARGMLQFTDATRTILQPNESADLLSQLSTSGD